MLVLLVALLLLLAWVVAELGEVALAVAEVATGACAMGVWLVRLEL